MSSLVSRSPAARLARACLDGDFGQYRVVAARPARPGTRLLSVHGVRAARPSRFSLQLGLDRHIAPPHGLDPDDPDPRYTWRYLNHSCDPNAALLGRALVAVQAIAPGAEITFDYNTTEWDIAVPFPCRCGVCGGRLIRGFRHLDPGERRRLAPRLAAHLRTLAHPLHD